MVTRDMYLPVAAQPTVDTLVEQAKRGEQLGYERAWLPESWGRDAVTTLAAIAEHTDDIGIGSSVMNVFSRSPALLGQTATTLQELADGRFRMGVGSSGPILIEGWHGTEFENPLRRTRETIEIIKAVTSGNQVEYDGEHYQLAGFRLRCDPPEPRPPVDAAGMGPKAVELAGRFGDGWHALMLTREGLRERLHDFDRGSELGDRDRSSQRVTLSLTCCALDERERARDLAREHACFYIGGMGTFYRDAMARQGHEEKAHDIATAWANGNRERAKETLTDELLDEVAVAGTPAECRDRIEQFEQIDGIDAVSVSFPRGADEDEIIQTAEVLAPTGDAS
jgi:coenzyme F420-dependent oxidoreductase